MVSDKDTVHLKITLTLEEYALLKEISELEGRPMAAVFMKFVRDGKIFKILERVLKALRVVHKIKSSVGRGYDASEDLN